MMVDYFVYEILTGEIVKVGRCQIAVLQLQAGPGQRAAVGRADPATQVYDRATDTLKPKPTPQPDPEGELAAKRARMSLTPRQLFIGMAAAGFVTQEEAVDAARTGAIPALVEAAVASLPPLEQTAARVTWARMTQVVRNDPLVALMGSAAGQTPEQIDAFFEAFATV